MFVIVIKLLIFASSNSSNFFLDRNNEINLNDQTLFNVILIRDQLSNLKFNLHSNNINIISSLFYVSFHVPTFIISFLTRLIKRNNTRGGKR